MAARCAGLAIPPDWQEAVICAAIGLKLCQHEETGAIVAALTTSIPEHAGSQRNWDYRYCWIRDAYYTVQALNRLGALDVLEGYLDFLRNIVGVARGGHIQPLYSVLGESELDEQEVASLGGYRGHGPVRVGTRRSTSASMMSTARSCSPTQAFFDCRLLRMSSLADFEALERVGERAWQLHDQPDAGLWNLHVVGRAHLFRSDALGRLRPAGQGGGGPADRQGQAPGRTAPLTSGFHRTGSLWRPEAGSMSAVTAGLQLDASLIQLLDLQFSPDDHRFRGTLKAVEEGLRRGSCYVALCNGG